MGSMWTLREVELDLPVASGSSAALFSKVFRPLF